MTNAEAVQTDFNTKEKSHQKAGVTIMLGAKGVVTLLF